MCISIWQDGAEHTCGPRPIFGVKWSDGWRPPPLRLLLLRRIVATDTNTVDDCLHLADYIRGGDRVGVGGGLGGGGEEEEADGGATLLRWRGRGRAREGGRREGKWMEDPKEEEKEWADGEKGPNWKIS